MCWDCFKLYADKPVVNAQVQAAYDLIHQEKRGFDLMHIIIEDMNLGDWLFDLKSEDNSWYAGQYPKAAKYEQDIYDTLASLTEAERATAIAMHWGYIERDGTLRPDIAAAEGE